LASLSAVSTTSWPKPRYSIEFFHEVPAPEVHRHGYRILPVWPSRISSRCHRAPPNTGDAASWNAVLMSAGRPRVIVVGGGFGGIRATRALTFTKNRPHRTITAEHVRDELTGEPEHPSRLRGGWAGGSRPGRDTVGTAGRKPQSRTSRPGRLDSTRAPAVSCDKKCREHLTGIRSARPLWPEAIQAGDNA
jgi:hypothetical protein